MEIPYFDKLRLVGGTSLALQMGHRKSVDIDLFGEMFTNEIEINNAISNFKNPKKLFSTPNIFSFLIDGIKVDLVNYKYPWIDECINFEKIRLAGQKDIGAMKLAAISGRGSKKDFFDIYFLLNQFSLKELFEFYNKKFPDGNKFLVIRSLIYFKDAEKDEIIPLKNISWEEVKKRITCEYHNFMNSI
jgi:hypothetical protein